MTFLRMFVVFTFLNGVACENLQRSPQSGFATEKAPHRRSPASLSASPLRLEIQRYEQSISNRRELEQYSKALPWFDSSEERFEFLSQGDLENRAQWLRERDFFARPALWEKKLVELIQNKDLVIGMPEPLVKKSWGEPDIIEVSGHPLFKNMRYRYNEQVATEDGFIPQRRSVYFEAGKVTGWDTN